VVSELPPVSQCVFIYLMAFLRELLRISGDAAFAAGADDNRVTADKLGASRGCVVQRG
jgi:hypothetical protein